MAQNNKLVYEVSVDYDTTINGDKLHAHNTIGIYEDVDDAVEAAMINSDDDLTAEDAKRSIDLEGYVGICGHPMMIGGVYAKHVVATVTEHALITSTKEP